MPPCPKTKARTRQGKPEVKVLYFGNFFAGEDEDHKVALATDEPV